MESKNTLHLILKKKWFDMISSGDKKEEYREIKRLYYVRLMNKRSGGGWEFKSFETVTFQHGYQKNAPRLIVEYLGTEARTGKEEWGADPDKKYFVIKLGKIISN